MTVPAHLPLPPRPDRDCHPQSRCAPARHAAAASPRSPGVLRLRPGPGAAPGSSLIEALVALAIIGIGLLGIAKMQALAIASNRGSSTHALVAIEAASLGASMHVNQLYWSFVASGSDFRASVTLNHNGPGGSDRAVINSSDAALAAIVNLQQPTPDCTANLCMGASLAIWDLAAWIQALNAIAPITAASVDCAGAPAVCTITVQWQQNPVSMNANTQAVQAAAATQPMSYSLVVQP